MRFCSIIVTYNPDLPHLEVVVGSMLDANLSVVIFDNSEFSRSSENKNFLLDKFSDRIIIIARGSNVGLSVAFNVSVRNIINLNSDIDAFLFFDQDSTVNKQSLLELIDSYKLLKKLNVPVGVLGAQPVDENGDLYRVSSAKDRHGSNLPKSMLTAEFVISSFSLVPATTFETVGFFDERLFIDLVDSEFSFRCSKFNLLNIIDTKVRFLHVIGTDRVSFLGRKLSISSPLRNYYQARNILLVAKKYHWYFWSAKLISRRFVQFSLSGIRNRDLLKRYKYMFQGLKDGVCNKGGKYPYA